MECKVLNLKIQPKTKQIKVSNNRQKICGLHACLKHILRLCRWSGHFLVDDASDYKTMRFNIKSVYLVYYLASLMILCQSTVIHLKQFIIADDSDLNDFGNVMLGSSGIIVTILMYRFSKHWPDLVQSALETEKNVANMVKISRRVHIKCAAVSYVVIVFSFVEHLLYTNFKLQREIDCSNVKPSFKEGFDKFLRSHYANFFDFLPFYEWIAIIAQFTRLQSCFMWNVSDVLGMCFSIYLTAYFQKLGHIIHSKKQKDWSKIRACYSQLAILINLINKQLAPFILLSAFYNLFFICKQLFGSINYILSKSILDKICVEGTAREFLVHSYLCYYIFSLLYLALRCLGFTYLATNVHTSASNAVIPLYEVPSTEFNEEVEIFQMQLRFNRIGLDGVFFYVDRQTILRVIATIITYELVLLQFSNLKSSTIFSENRNDTAVLGPIIN